jgi:Na+-translocating ferredoxin:NAD+ oxidoreductase RnfC subunit
MSHPIVDKVRKAGVVGAGGAGFPTHVKLSAKADTFLVNSVECEPLLYKDKELMRLQAARMVEGLRLGMDATGAARGIIALKAKAKDAIAALEPHMMGPLSLHLMDNYYPAGDEYCVVYDCTGRRIPRGGIPLQVGCVVSNTESLVNVALADQGIPVVQKAVTVAGEVAQPSTFIVPVGISAREVIAMAGGATVDDPVLIDGGPMMGPCVTDLDAPVTKVSAGWVVLSRQHKLAQRKLAPEDQRVRIAKASCDQCVQCTELCPRYLLGYAVEPHKVMRMVGFAGELHDQWGRHGLLCCECNICEYYACPEDLTPRSMCVRAKGSWSAKGKWPEHLDGLGRVHPMREARRVPVSRLVHRLGINQYDVQAPMRDFAYEPPGVRIMLKQHLGAPTLPVVAPGQKVSLGQVLAEPPAGKLGAPVHASIDGRVASIDETSIRIERI